MHPGENLIVVKKVGGQLLNLKQLQEPFSRRIAKTLADI
jgi:hypothetical protein